MGSPHTKRRAGRGASDGAAPVRVVHLEQVEQVGEELVRVLLRVAAELRRALAHALLDRLEPDDAGLLAAYGRHDVHEAFPKAC